MHTGLIHEFSIQKPSKHSNLDDFKAAAARAVVNNPESYDLKEVKGMYSWTLRREAREAHLVDLLSRFYADFYGPQSDYFIKNCRSVIAHLSTNPSDEELIAWILESEEFPELDDWSRRVIVNGENVTVHFSLWSLTYEGKVIVEELDLHSAFFERAIRRMYAGNPLGGSLAVDVG